VKLTRALDRDLDEAIKEVNLLGEHEGESSQKITDEGGEHAQKLREEKTTLEGMIQSCDKLILEMAEEYGLNRMGETHNDEDEDDDDDDEGNAVSPPAPAPLPCLRRSSKKKTPWRMVHKSWMIWMTWVIWMMIRMKAALTWMNGFPKMGVMMEIESSSLSLYV
jgi:hypothetical protein